MVELCGDVSWFSKCDVAELNHPGILAKRKKWFRMFACLPFLIRNKNSFISWRMMVLSFSFEITKLNFLSKSLCGQSFHRKRHLPLLKKKTWTTANQGNWRPEDPLVPGFPVFPSAFSPVQVPLFSKPSICRTRLVGDIWCEVAVFGFAGITISQSILGRVASLLTWTGLVTFGFFLGIN